MNMKIIKIMIHNIIFIYKHLVFSSIFLNENIYKTMYKNYIKENITFVSIVIFIVLFGIIQLTKPSFLYNRDGSPRDFGIGYKNKTILPIWLLSIVLGIFSYLIVLYYTSSIRFV